MSHTPTNFPGVAGSIISAITSFLFLGVSLTQTHPEIQDLAILLSICAAIFSITASGVNIWKHLKK